MLYAGSAFIYKAQRYIQVLMNDFVWFENNPFALSNV